MGEPVARSAVQAYTHTPGVQENTHTVLLGNHGRVLRLLKSYLDGEKYTQPHLAILAQHQFANWLKCFCYRAMFSWGDYGMILC